MSIPAIRAMANAFKRQGSTLALLEFWVLLIDDEESPFTSDDLAIR